MDVIGSITYIHCSPSNEHSILLPVYNWADGDYDAINERLKSLDWQSLLGNIFDVDLIWSSFTSVVWPIIPLYIPKRLVSHKTKYRFKKYPSSIRTLLSRKAALWRKLKSAYSEELKNRYTYVSMICKQAILDFDVEIENRILKANNLGAFYKFFNNKLGSRGGIAPSMIPWVLFWFQTPTRQICSISFSNQYLRRTTAVSLTFPGVSLSLNLVYVTLISAQVKSSTSFINLKPTQPLALTASLRPSVEMLKILLFYLLLLFFEPWLISRFFPPNGSPPPSPQFSKTRERHPIYPTTAPLHSHQLVAKFLKA